MNCTGISQCICFLYQMVFGIKNDAQKKISPTVFVRDTNVVIPINAVSYAIASSDLATSFTVNGVSFEGHMAPGREEITVYGTAIPIGEIITVASSVDVVVQYSTIEEI